MTATPQAEPGISDELLYKKLGFKPHSSGQSEYLYSTTRFNIPCCGRRYGKSQVAGHRMTHKSFVPDSINWIIGTSYRIGEKEFRVVWNDYQELGILKYCRKAYSQHQGDMYIRTPWNSLILVVSADNQDSLLGEGLSHAILCESARHDRSIWEQYIEPALSDLKGTCDFPSTPKGYNWYHGLWMLGQESAIFNNQFNAGKKQLTAYRSWQFPTWENTVRFPGGFEDPEIQRVYQVVSSHWFRQEYGAEFTAMTGSIYEEFREDKHVIQAADYDFHPDWPNYLAFDYGFANPFVCLDIQVDPATDTAYVWREYYETQRSTMEHGWALVNRESPPGYHVDGMWGDPRGADEAATLAQIIGYVAFEDVRWKRAVEQIKRMLKHDPPKLLVTTACPNLVRQMLKLHVKEQGKNTKFDLQEQTGDGNIQHKVDDHAADALRYFIGPYFVAGADSHITDIYGENYKGSESEDFFTLNTQVVMDDVFTVGNPFGV